MYGLLNSTDLNAERVIVTQKSSICRPKKTSFVQWFFYTFTLGSTRILYWLVLNYMFHMTIILFNPKIMIRAIRDFWNIQTFYWQSLWNISGKHRCYIVLVFFQLLTKNILVAVFYKKCTLLFIEEMPSMLDWHGSQGYWKPPQSVHEDQWVALAWHFHPDRVVV